MNDYKVDHLFLLVGKNPLPNYVVAESNVLLRESGEIYLIYTSETINYAEKLRVRLDLNNGALVSLGDFQSDGFKVRECIRKKAEKLTGRLGLNYTGGTKSMAVNAYLSIQSIKREESPVFSYLDSKELKLIIDQPNIGSIPVPIDVDVAIEDIFDLHQLSLIHPPSRQIILADLASVIVQHTKSWRHWCDSILRNQCRRIINNGKTEWLSSSKLKVLQLSVEDLDSELINALANHNCLDVSRQHICIDTFSERREFSGLKAKDIPQKICEWLDGIWLENYLMSQLYPLFQNVGMSFRVDIGGKKDFQFDVAFVKGYQLFAFSCTSSDDRGLCKSKLFEAYIRAKQLGGDEARVALICCSDDDSLEHEMEVAIADPKIRVFGRSHLVDIANEVSDWVNSFES